MYCLLCFVFWQWCKLLCIKIILLKKQTLLSCHSFLLSVSWPFPCKLHGKHAAKWSGFPMIFKSCLFPSVLWEGETFFTHCNYFTDPKQNTSLTFDGKKVVVPQGKAIANPGWHHSHFSQSEYLIYKESQNRIRYLLLMDF